jgi:hypothetical protein
MVNFSEYFYYNDGKLIRKSTNDVAGWLSPEGYICFRLKGKTYKAHRAIFQMFHGYCPDKIDHINGIRSDNRIENLRPATDSQNCMNRIVCKSNKLGIKGVNYHKASKKFIAQATLNSKKVYLGVYDTVEEAKTAYDNFIKINHGEFANYG